MPDCRGKSRRRHRTWREAPRVNEPRPHAATAAPDTGPHEAPAPTFGVVNYMAPASEPSLYRNGKVFTRRDLDGNDAVYEGVVTDEFTVAIDDARSAQGGRRRTLDVHGFELLDRPLAKPGLDFYDHAQVVRDYYPECEAILRETTGAACVRAFDHNIRSTAGNQDGRRIRGGQQVQGPAHIVHGDYTLSSGPQRLRDLAKPPGANDTLHSVLAEGEALLDWTMVDRVLTAGGRFAIINVWRNIDTEPVESQSLALCDGQIVEPDELVVFEIHYRDRIGENYFAKHAPRHGWWWYPAVIRDEALLIKQWDSAGGLGRSGGARGDATGGDRSPCTFSFHTAFKDPATPPDARDRQSIEVRCVLLYD